MADLFDDRSSGLESPGTSAADVVPNDATDLPVCSRALYVGAAGDIRLTTVNNSTVTLRNLPAGILPMRVRRVFATGTTATDIVAVW